MLKYNIMHEGVRTIVSLEGDLDIDATELMEEEINSELTRSQEIEIDFSKVPFVDSSGIGLLITLITNLREHGIKVEIIKINAEVKQVFDLLQLPDILGLDVLADFRKPESGEVF